MSLSILGDFQSIRLTLIDTPGEGSHCALLSLRLHCSQAVGSAALQTQAEVSPVHIQSSPTCSRLAVLFWGYTVWAHSVGTWCGYTVWRHGVVTRCGYMVWWHDVVA